MNIKEAKEIYKSLKGNIKFVKTIEPEFFIEFAETVLQALENKDKEIAELKENSITKYEIKKVILTMNDINISTIDFHGMVQVCEDYMEVKKTLQELLGEGETNE